jgi:hypothetical protein
VGGGGVRVGEQGRAATIRRRPDGLAPTVTSRPPADMLVHAYVAGMGIPRRTQSMRAEVDEQSYARRSRAEAAGSTAPPRQAGVARRAIQTPCALRGQAPAGPRLAASASGTTSPSSVSPQSLDPPRQQCRIGGRRRRGIRFLPAPQRDGRRPSYLSDRVHKIED